LLRFQHTEFIWLFAALLVLAILFAGVIYWKKKITKKMGDERLVKALTGNYSSNKFFLKFFLVLLAFAGGILAVMNLRKPGAADNSTRQGIDVAIALDVSKSMLANDMPPDRLERARQFINKLMDAMPDDRIALILFAGKAYMQMPLTADLGAARLFVSAANPDAIPQQGTVISEALQMSAKVFNSAERRFKTIVLISDGEDHDEAAKRTASALSEQGIMINTVGIGSVEGSTIPDPITGDFKKDASGNTVVSKLNESILQEIARETNGIYLRLQGSDEAVTQLKAQLAQIERKAYGDVSLMNFQNYYPWFAGAMLLLLLAETLIPERKRKKA
jgi:Ca-activated chloride channel homolog